MQPQRSTPPSAIVAVEEGIEINVLGLSAGIDLLRPTLRLPGFGRIGVRKSVGHDKNGEHLP